MNITRELLEAQRREAVKRRDTALAQLNHENGILLALDNLIAISGMPEPPPPAPKKEPPAPPAG